MHGELFSSYVKLDEATGRPNYTRYNPDSPEGAREIYIAKEIGGVKLTAEEYIKPYTGRVLTRAAFTFGTRVEKFRAACEKLGGLALPNGDAGFEFTLIGDFRMRILVWAGDEEFPPNTQVLYTDNFAEGFAAEDRVVAGDILISHIKASM